ncbi:MAG: TetR family transcriptional regulator [Clostridia bacterium]|nr:TetR family transcriptional regulator [Clostridia bacterium]
MTQIEKSELTKRKILAAAESEFSEKGIWGSRIDAIASSAGVNKRMIYEHYESKENLYKTVLERVYARLAEYENENYIKNLPPDEAIKNIVDVSFRFLESNPTFVRILMWENLNNAKYLDKDSASNIKNPTINYIKEQIRLGKDTGVFSRDVDEEQIVISLLNFEFSYFSNIHTLSNVLKINLSDSSEIRKRSRFVSERLIK